MKSKSQILGMIERFLKGSSDTEVQQALSEMGMGPAQISGLAEARDLFSSNDLDIQLALSNKKLATRRKNEARAHACALVSNMARIIKLIEPNSKYLSALQLETRYKTVKASSLEPGEEGETVMRKAVSQAKSDGELRVYLSGILGNLPNIPEALRAEMARFGWDATWDNRLTQAIHAFDELYAAREQVKRDYHQKVHDNQKAWRRLIQLFRAFNGNVKCQMKAFPHISARLKLMTGTLNSTPARPQPVDTSKVREPAPRIGPVENQVVETDGLDSHEHFKEASSLPKPETSSIITRKTAPVFALPARRRRMGYGGRLRFSGGSSPLRRSG